MFAAISQNALLSLWNSGRAEIFTTT